MGFDSFPSAHSKTAAIGVSRRALPSLVTVPREHGVPSEAACIAVVDDDPSMLRSLGRLLLAHGFDVRTYQAAPALLHDAAALRPSCIIADLVMPIVDGLELQRSLFEAGLSIPLVFITGRGDIRSSVLAMRHGAVDFLSKPFAETDLFEAVERALERDRASRAASKLTAAYQQRAASLTPREHDVFVSVVDGLMNKQIAAKLGIAEKTVKLHRARIMKKMEVRSIARLARMAERFGFVRTL